MERGAKLVDGDWIDSSRRLDVVRLAQARMKIGTPFVLIGEIVGFDRLYAIDDIVSKTPEIEWNRKMFDF